LNERRFFLAVENTRKRIHFMDLFLKDKVALVTGAGSGMGLATAQAFAAEGAAVALIDIDESAVRTATERLIAAGHKAIALGCDVTDETQVKAMVEQTVSAFGHLDVAFNNAGVQSLAIETADATSQEFDRVNAINLRSVRLCMKYELLQMRRQGSGAIVNNSSTQRNKRAVKGTHIPPVSAPKLDSVCRGCGAHTQRGRHCPKCGREVSREKLIELAKTGRIAARSAESRKKHSETQRRHEAAKRAWRSSAKPAWLNEGTYRAKIQPRLALITISTLASTLGVSGSYAADIRAGRHRPHPRHWQALAQLAEVLPPG
jgi:hypothetical protein